MWITNFFFATKRSKKNLTSLQTCYFCLKINLKGKIKWFTLWKNITLRVLKYQLFLSRLSNQYGNSHSVLKNAQIKMMYTISTLLIIFKFTFETDFLNSFKLKKKWIKKKIKLIKWLKYFKRIVFKSIWKHFLNYNNKNFIENDSKSIGLLLTLILKPLLYNQKKLFSRNFRNRSFYISICIIHFFFESSWQKQFVNDFLILKNYKGFWQKYINFSLISKKNLIVLIYCSYILSKLSAQILKNLLWFTFKINLIKKFNWGCTIFKYNTFLLSKSYYCFSLKYNIFCCFNHFMIFFKGKLWFHFLVNFKLRKLFFSNKKIKKKISFKNYTFKILSNLQRTILYMYNYKSLIKLIFSINKIIWSLYIYFKWNIFWIHFKKLDLCFYWHRVQLINKKLFKNCFNSKKYYKQKIFFINFKHLNL